MHIMLFKEHFSQEPDNTIVQLGDNVTLNCIFDKEIDCVWQRNGFELDISNRYDYIDEKKGKMTKDCSIRLRNVTRWDIARWVCGSMGDSRKDGIMSKEVRLIDKSEQNSTNGTCI